jgi:hypothetical protein
LFSLYPPYGDIYIVVYYICICQAEKHISTIGGYGISLYGRHPCFTGMDDLQVLKEYTYKTGLPAGGGTASGVGEGWLTHLLRMGRRSILRALYVDVQNGKVSCVPAVNARFLSVNDRDLPKRDRRSDFEHTE